ncbi:protein-glucosylgalactosylhydroxylysine glucosidase-like [Liolophura sinensis]|uniref:protein-glucosylgalactosylhydroxylysine glucosidase-like n=1 Tax=Liolophura sinensis TaxID=3198878 RepID=UPI003158FD73
MFRLCLDMKVKTLGMIVCIILLMVFISIYYATSTASKVTARDKTLHSQQQQQQPVVKMEKKYPPGVNVEQMTEEWTGKQGRRLHPEDGGIPVVVHSAPKHLPADLDVLRKLPPEATVFTTDQLPSDPRLRPGIGNGQVATVVYSDSIYMNGLYNGFHSDSHRARIPAFCSVQITGVNPPAEFHRTYSLNVSTGIFTETIKGAYFQVDLKMYAHRRVRELLVSELWIRRSDINKKLGVSLSVNKGPDSEDIDFEQSQTMIANSRYVHGRIKTPEFNDSVHQEVHVYYSEVPANISLMDSMSESTWLFLTSVSQTRKGAEDNYDKGLKLFQVKSLAYSHMTIWAELWNDGRIDIEGNTAMAQLAYSSLYYLLSCLPSEEDPNTPFIGLSPAGLDHGSAKEDYWGHVMWDQETWQYPPILMLYPSLASILLGTRARTLDAAKRQAKLRGYQGAMYPWESAVTGRDVTRCQNCSLYEQHITGDIALAIQQYMYMTNDTSFLQDRRGGEIITAIAEFWASRVTKDKTTGKYGIQGVMPPDEYHYPVDNSAYTNSIAALSLMLPYSTLPLIGKQPPPIFREIASNVYIPFDSAMNYHPEYDGYTLGTKVKQADVILLGFPLNKEFDSSIRKNDLSVYSEVTDPEGPAMTWQMFTIGWLEFKDTTKAKTYLDKSMENAKGPFKVWTEESGGGGAVNFRTGMGGYLQSLLFGYGGLRIFSEGLYLDPILPPSSTKFTITGLDYLGNALTLEVNQKNTIVTVTVSGQPLVLTVPGISTKYPLNLNQPVTISKHKALIKLNTDPPQHSS